MWEIVYYAVLILLAYYLAPKPQSMPPARVSDSDIPICQIGVEIPVLFGTRDLSGPNVVWYGDVRTEELKSSGGKK